MLCHDAGQFRTINRRGLYDPDGGVLSEHVIRAAQSGSAVDLDVCHLAVRDMVFNMCNSAIARMVREFDLENNVWFTSRYDECGRYADDILCDWRAFGTGTYPSLHDTAAMYVNEILACPKPDRVFDSNDDFVFTAKHGTIPKALHDPARPAQYQVGEGHRDAPDGVGHPLLAHMVSCVPPALVPHGKSGCSAKLGPGQKLRAISPGSAEKTTQAAKEEDVARMVDDVQPDAAYVLERCGRHDLLLYGDIDAAEAFRRAESVQARHGTPLGCMVVESDALLHDECGNDAKNIVANGTRLAGSLKASGRVAPPRPAALSKDDLVVNLDRHGFPICTHDPPETAARVRPEYVIAASYFTNEPRWYLSGTAVLLCRSKIDWGLILYLARVYGFARTLHGILNRLAEEGRTLGYPLSALREYGAVKIGSDMRETLRVYGLAHHGTMPGGNAAVGVARRTAARQLA